MISNTVISDLIYIGKPIAFALGFVLIGAADGLVEWLIP